MSISSVPPPPHPGTTAQGTSTAAPAPSGGISLDASDGVLDRFTEAEKVLDVLTQAVGAQGPTVQTVLAMQAAIQEREVLAQLQGTVVKSLADELKNTIQTFV